MNITPLNNFSIYNRNIAYRPNYSFRNGVTNPVSFWGNISDEKYRQAKEYADHYKNEGFYERYGYGIDDLDLNKLDGIQKDIDVFDGLSMRDIYYTFYNIGGILARRGCTNQCGHCFVDAKPPIREDVEHINSMPFEDYVDILDGIKELNKRIGTPIFTNDYEIKHNSMLSLFLDADCMEIALRDKNGNIHEMPELIDKFYDATGKPMLFDTASWNHKHPVMQKRAERYVEYFSKPENQKKVDQINLSLSPFHAIYMKSLDILSNSNMSKSEKKEKSEMLYNTYTDRMANMLVTFSPLIDNSKFSVIARPLKNGIPNMYNFSQRKYNTLTNDILEKVNERLNEDLNGDKKYVSDKAEIEEIVSKYREKMSVVDSSIIMNGRFERLFKSKNPEMSDRDIQSYFSDYRPRTKNGVKIQLPAGNYDRLYRYIDANGKVYLTDYTNVIPTELQLNLSSKNKATRDLSGEMLTDATITKEHISTFDPSNDYDD